VNRKKTVKTSPYQIFDPVYGELSLPGFLRPFIESPEFRRLGSIRLLNFESTELAALSEVRRLSHTLGVLHLATRVTTLHFGPDEIKALMYAIVLHDIGTPPFGHSLEYEFARKYGLDHEAIATRVLDLTHHWLAADHQIYRGAAVTLSKAIKLTGVEECIRSILSRRHPLSLFLFSDIDLDNIDNVYRMSKYLGVAMDASVPLTLSSSLDVNSKGQKLLSQKNDVLIQNWLDMRAASYRIILGTPRHRQNQTVFSRIIYEALEQGLIDISDWFSIDERMIKRLDEARSLRSYFRDLYTSEQLRVYGFRIEASQSLKRTELLDHRDRLTEAIEERTGKQVYVSLSPYGEVISRQLAFIDPDGDRPWTIGSTEPTYHLHVYLRPETLRGRTSEIAEAMKSEVDCYAESQRWHLNRPSL